MQLDPPLNILMRSHTDRGAGFLRHKGLRTASAGARFIDPAVAYDAVHPGVQSRSFLPLVARLQRAFERGLAQIVGVRRVAGERSRKPPQPREQGQELTLE